MSIIGSYDGFSDNAVIVTGSEAIQIQGAAPFVTVKSDPYLMYLSYGQFTRIIYNLQTPGNQDAVVDLRILPPGIIDIDDPSAIKVLDQVIQSPGDHEVEWTGIDSLDTDMLKRTILEEGVYNFAIRARVGTRELVHRGVISTYQ